MDRNLYERACERLEITKRKFSTFVEVGNGPQAREAWGDFIMWADACYVGLGHAATGLKSALWFEVVKTYRAHDPLHSYLHQARHSHQHGLGPKPTVAAKVKTGEKAISTLYLRGKKTNQALRLDLVPIESRSFSLDVPDRHKNAPIERNILVFAKAEIAHIEQRFAEAERFVLDPSDVPMPARPTEPRRRR